MRKISLLLLFTQLAHANNWIDLKPDTQNRLNQALQLPQTNTTAHNRQGTNFVTVECVVK